MHQRPRNARTIQGELPMRTPARHLPPSFPPLRMVAVALLALHAGAGAASLPPEPAYKGELMSDGKGGVTVKPFVVPDERRENRETQNSAPMEHRAPAVRKAQLQAEAAPKNAPATGPSTLQVGPGRQIHTISEAAKMARNGDTILVDPGVYAGDVAVFNQDRLTIRATGGRARLAANGANAEGKAIWVVRGGHIVVENFEFTGARVPDRNGAGIRFENGTLVVRNCLFRDNENGILSSNNKDAELQIENSEFDHNGTEEGRAHQLYAGDIGRLQVSGSYFHNTVGGHLLKSRAAINMVTYNRLTDENGGRASYELEFPSGGVSYVIGNIIEQSPTTDNSNIIAFGLEGYKWPKNELYLINNTIVDDRPANGVFLRLAPGLQLLKATNNMLVGDRKHDFAFLSGDAGGKAHAAGKSLQLPDFSTRQGEGGMKIESSNNFNPQQDEFAQAARYDYRLREHSALTGKYKAPGTANGIDLTPRAEYAHPAHIRQLSAPPTLPGALQSPAH
jgi:hypothetical protein